MGRTSRLCALQCHRLRLPAAMVLGLTVDAGLAPGGLEADGAIMSIGLIIVYALVSASLPFFFLRQHRSEFSRSASTRPGRLPAAASPPATAPFGRSDFSLQPGALCRCCWILVGGYP